ncbi:hypothetical protein A9G13_06440 [Gilliamella sp. wkB178]|uniref:hypothetical protein n=1 Tax=Gilliamella sp. wkB178 TaxID=3120259 RepID=UPI00080EDA2A|nr:hypothetical protein [Gilliamella apicola]OCG07847.1 hypothetical protein A9G13_06440 [Gilliamella apicola]
MPYTGRHKTQDTRHKHWQLYVQNLSQHTVVDSFHRSDNLVPDLVPHRRHNRQLNHPNQKLLSLTPLPPNRQLSPLSLIKRQPRFGSNLKRCLALMSLLLLPYATTTQALSATTAQVIHGSAPYFTFDNGATKFTTGDGLLGITISDGTTKITYTPADNTSTVSNPIVLLKENQRFTDIGMLVPPTTDSITLNDLISAPYNYWGDDDGDGQGANGVTASGNLSVSITNKYSQVVSRSVSLDICQAPYKVVLTSTDGSLTTQYGLPNSTNFSGSSTTYYISPKAPPKICYARPNMEFGTNSQEIPGFNFAGSATIWNWPKGFLVQSTTPSSYNRNFPTTGANNLHFDLLVGGIDAATLTWPTVTQGGITATMTVNPPRDSYFNPDGASSVRVTLTGPLATASQQSSATPGSIATPTLPQTFVLVGKDSSNNEVLKYGFKLQHWFVHRGTKEDTPPNQSSWCRSLGGGYRLPQVKDLTNAVCSGANSTSWCQGAVGATPSSSGNHYQRNIGAGLFTEWGSMYFYTAAGFVYNYYWTSDSNGSNQFYVNSNDGYVGSGNPRDSHYGVCAYP